MVGIPIIWVARVRLTAVTDGHRAYASRAGPRDAPERPSITSDYHQQQPVNLKVARAFKPRATHGNTLVIVGRGSQFPCPSGTVLTDHIKVAEGKPRPVRAGGTAGMSAPRAHTGATWTARWSGGAQPIVRMLVS
jgi:hypothetical protein